MRKRYRDEQNIKAIKKHDAGAKVEDICRDLVISNGTF
jgi:putative transposase